MKNRHYVIGRVVVIGMFSAMLTACGGSDQHARPSPADSRESYLGEWYAAKIAVVQCLIAADLIPQNELRDQKWLQGGKVVPGEYFDIWYDSHPTARYGGNKLENWVSVAMGVIPTDDCKAIIPGAKKVPSKTS